MREPHHPGEPSPLRRTERRSLPFPFSTMPSHIITQPVEAPCLWGTEKRMKVHFSCIIMLLVRLSQEKVIFLLGFIKKAALPT